jgi:crotonobetainyl-CoA:carnitine CoA-transferase CaiB-like acyl-CoA transferase
LRVLDLSRVLAGPWASQTLADLGAEVIKIEEPRQGDQTRRWGPPFLAGQAAADEQVSTYFLAANRGKQSVTINIACAAGQELIKDLAAHADILLENFKVGQLGRYGLDYESLKQNHPQLIYCSISGFGQSGPYCDRPGYDFLAQAMGGLISITGQRSEQDQRQAGVKAGVAVADLFTGLYATIAVLSALHARQSSGKGDRIDVSLFEVQVATLANQATAFLSGGVVPRPMGNEHPSIVPYQSFPVADGQIALAVATDDQFRALCQALAADDLPSDPRYRTNTARVLNREALTEALTEIFQHQTKATWLARLQQAGIACGPINDIEAVFADPQLQARGMVLDRFRFNGTKVTLPASPISFADGRAEASAGPPRLGEHTEHVLGRLLGLRPDEIDCLRRTGVI